MDFWRKILILAIIVLFSYILWRLLLKRQEILLEQSRPTSHIENFTPASNAVSISSINVNALTKTNGITDPMTAKQLKQFVIKGSYHTCYTGSDLSASMVEYALKRGYRWLDFCTADGSTVCYTTDDTLNGMTGTSTSVLFGDIATQIQMHGFISPDSPNSKDPIFIQIRPLWKDDASKDVTLKTTIDNFSKTPYNLPVYTGHIDKNTTIDQLLGKVVIVIDQSIIKIGSLHNNDNTFMTSLPISQASGLKAPIPLTLADNFTTTPPDKIYQFFPTGATGNSDVYSTIQVIGAQITPMCIWANDTPLANYEAIFNNANAGIVPLSTVLKFTKTNNPSVTQSSYPGAFAGK
jgi:hypothetical protein